MTVEQITILGVAIALIGVGVALAQLWVGVRPLLDQYKTQLLLRERFSRGPYDGATIAQSTRYYIRPKCSNIDPAQEQEIRRALVATREDLFKKVDYFLDHDDSQRHLLILADSGTGKTSFVLNYYAHNAARRRKRHRLALVPLGAKDADTLIASIPEPDDTIIFLDALDEDVKAIADHHARLRSLMDSCRRFKRVVLTCRTQFFPHDEEIPVETGIARLGPRKAGEKGTYEFWKLYLSPFDDADADRYLRLRYPLWAWSQRHKARAVAQKIPLLSARPMLLAHIPDIVASSRTITHSYQLYEVMIDAWLDREATWVDKEALRSFSEHIAIDIYVNRLARGMERVPYGQLSYRAKEWGIRLEQWQLSGRSLLNRDAQGNYKFAHRSIMEYLFVLRLISGDVRCYGVVLTDQMKRFLTEMLGASPQLNGLQNLLQSVELIAHGTHDLQNCISEQTKELFMGEINPHASEWHSRRINPNPISSRNARLEMISDKQGLLQQFPGLKEMISEMDFRTRTPEQMRLYIDPKTKSTIVVKVANSPQSSTLELNPVELPQEALVPNLDPILTLYYSSLPMNQRKELARIVQQIGVPSWHIIREFNKSPDARLEPIGPTFQQFALWFVLPTSILSETTP